MQTNKPAVHLYTVDETLPAIREICAGMEEEGVPWKILRMDGTARGLAYRAATDSVLESGIGLTAGEVALQMRKVAEDRPLFVFADPTAEQYRMIGANAARAVKKKRFVTVQAG
jgi:hypothetical protein